MRLFSLHGFNLLKTIILINISKNLILAVDGLLLCNDHLRRKEGRDVSFFFFRLYCPRRVSHRGPCDVLRQWCVMPVHPATMHLFSTRLPGTRRRVPFRSPRGNEGVVFIYLQMSTFPFRYIPGGQLYPSGYIFLSRTKVIYLELVVAILLQNA